MGLEIRITDQIKSAFYAKFDLKEYFLAGFRIDYISRKALWLKGFHCIWKAAMLVIFVNDSFLPKYKMIVSN